MELIKKRMHQNRIGKRIVDQFIVDDDYNVPDTKHDVARIVWSEGTLKIDDIKRVDNYLRVMGRLDFQVLYVTDEEEPRLASLDGKIPVEEMVYTEEEPSKNFYVADTRVDFNAIMIHSRKLSIKAMAELELGADELADEELPVDLECDYPLYKKQKEMNLLQMNTSKKDTYRIKEEITIPGTKENIGMLLWTDVSSRRLDTKLETGELKLLGELLVFCFYESQEGKVDWVEQSVPYEGHVALAGVDESMFHHVNAQLEDVNVDVRMDEDGEMRTLGVEGTLELRLAIYEEEAVELLEDVYSLEKDCQLKTSDACYEELMMQNHSKCKVSEQLSLPEIKDDILQICHSSGILQIENTEVTDEGIQIEGILHINFLYVKANDRVPFDTWQGMVPFSYMMEGGETCPDMRYDITSALEQLSVTLLGSDEIEVKAVLAFHSFLRRPVEAKIITDVTFEPLPLNELEKRPGVVGYIIKEGDDLWSLAKRYNTTVEGIMEVNELTGENMMPGDKILIFKENMSIL